MGRGPGRWIAAGAALLAAAVLAGAAAAGAVLRSAAGEDQMAARAAVERAFAVVDTLPSLPDSAFVRLVTGLSEPDRYFDTDNLISNEASYLHVVDELGARGVRGGVYVGVGPAQNFSYLTAVRPVLAFLIDIRRDNLLQHLWYKALLEAAESRLDYLCLLTARSCGGPSAGLAIEELVARVDAAAPIDPPAAMVERMVEGAGRTGVPLSADDRAYIGSVHERFAASGLDLRFRTHGRAPRPYYPTLRELLLERDGAGRRSNYLATEEGYRWLAALQRSNRVVPVVGDLAGDHALRALARELADRDREVSAFYASNVEFYLFGDGVFPRFIENLRALPVRDDAVVIRSYFHRFRPIPQTVPGYASTQLLHGIPALIDDWDAGRVRGYRDLISLSER